MNELENNFVHWRKVFLRTNLVLAILVTLVEIVMSFFLHFQNLILQNTLSEYIIEYIIIPNAIIWGSLLCMAIIIHFVNENRDSLQKMNSPSLECGNFYDQILNSVLILMMTISVGTVAYVHYIFRVTVAGFAIPIFLSIVFYSRTICIQTMILSELMILGVAWHRYSRESLQGIMDSYLFEDVVIIMMLVFVIGLIALNMIKHLKEQRDQLVKAREAAVVANQAKSSFLANMSHEIRTPINAIMGMDEMILRKSKDDEILSYAGDIESASNSLLSIINDILDVSKIESGKMEILPVEYELSSLIHDVYSNIAIKARDKDLDIILEVDEKLPNVLIGDDIRIRQIITNLLSNGVKYTPMGSVTLSVGGGVRNDGKLLLRVSVKDTGIGIREEDLPRLRDKFERFDSYRNRNIEGTGLGMSISVSLLELMDSSLKVESQYGVGSEFSFEILQEVVDESPIGNLNERFREAAQKARQQEKPDWIAPKAKLLVVDDNALNLKVFNQLLKQFMMRIDQADSGEACLEKVKQVQYDIIFLDDMMPGMNGRETLAAMRELAENQCIHTPVIALTANAIKGAMENYLKTGFDGYLAKPIASDKLEKMILDLLPPDVVQYDGEESDQNLIYEVDENGNFVDDFSDEVDHSEQFPEFAASDSSTSANRVNEAKDEDENLAVTSFPEVKGINWQYGMTVWCNADLLLELARDFEEELDGNIQKLGEWEEHLEDEECLKQFLVRVHSLKGSSATIGAMSLSSMAKILEMAAKAGNVEKIHLLWPDLKEMLEELKENMQVLFEK